MPCTQRCTGRLLALCGLTLAPSGQRHCANSLFVDLSQLDSITLATSPRQIEHKPTSSRSPPLTAPVKLVMVVSSLHLLHQTLESSSFLVSGGIAVHSLAAAGVNSGIFSTFTMFMPLLYARSLPKAAHRSRSRLRRCQIEGLLRQSAA